MDKKNFFEQLKQYEAQLQNYHMPRYKDLPDFGLYMDQVVSYVNKSLNVFEDENANLITPSMINNYVKHGIMPAPKGKKYGATHIAYICAIYFLKQVLSMDEIKSAVNHQLKCKNELEAYAYFCNELEVAFKNCCLLTKKQFVEEEMPDNAKFGLKAVTISIANLLYAQKVIGLHASIDKEYQDKIDEEMREQKEKEKQREKEIKEEKKKEKKAKKEK